MKYIPLGHGKMAIISDEDYPRISKFTWRINGNYVRHDVAIKDKTKKSGYKVEAILLHRLIIGAKKNEIVDHINRDTLDNSRENLRISTASQNSLNQKFEKNTVSGYTGVSWNPRDKRWQARIQVNKQRIQLGYFKLKKDAISAYKKERLKYV